MLYTELNFARIWSSKAYPTPVFPQNPHLLRLKAEFQGIMSTDECNLKIIKN